MPGTPHAVYQAYTTAGRGVEHAACGLERDGRLVGAGTTGIAPSASPGAPQLARAIPGPPAGSRAEAAALAQLMLSRLRLQLPPGAPIPPAEAQVTWYPPRTAAEYIDPARYHVLTVTAMVGGLRPPHTVHAIVTSQAFITRLATSLDRAQAGPDVTVPCPGDFADYQLAFSVSRHSRPVVVVWSTQNGCGGSRITVDGQRQPSLADDGTVAALSTRLSA